jgi:4-hydroxy-3-methylbut-2-en-1-yl diphosphate reductase
VPINILLARSAGFCFGVKRATRMAFEAAESHDGICSLGPIIHSPQLVKKLEEKGVVVVDEVNDIPEGAVIIRSHGVTSGELKEINGRHLEVVDATCPFVKSAQDHAALLSREGYAVVLVGESEHPEVQGILSYAESGDVFVVGAAAEAEAIPRRKRLGLIAQTTQSFETFRQVAAICLDKCQELRIFNTICDATSVRQDEAQEIARRSDLVLVIGGFNSANTSRLAQICADIQPRTQHIETAEQLRKEWFEGVETVGITAGASTPRWLVDEVILEVQRISN